MFKIHWNKKDKCFDFTIQVTTKLQTNPQIKYNTSSRQLCTCKNYEGNIKTALEQNVTFKMVLIPPGKFQMILNNTFQEVTIRKPFWLGKYPVTQKQWLQIMGTTPSFFKGYNRPVEQVSWEDCQEFCTKTSLRLPLNYEWEYACRAGSEENRYFSDNESLDEYAWYNENSCGTTHEVGKKKPNTFGLHDMLGNVFEWCLDWYGYEYNENSIIDDFTGDYKVVRGDSWRSNRETSTTHLYGLTTFDYENEVGFRLCADVK